LINRPHRSTPRTLQLIDEANSTAIGRQAARIFAKLNAIVDHRVIEALYRASQAGVSIDIIDRGICACDRIPALPITFASRSIVDRFLEHSRIYVFGPDSEAKCFCPARLDAAELLSPRRGDVPH